MIVADAHRPSCRRLRLFYSNARQRVSFQVVASNDLLQKCRALTLDDQVVLTGNQSSERLGRSIRPGDFSVRQCFCMTDAKDNAGFVAALKAVAGDELLLISLITN